MPVELGMFLYWKLFFSSSGADLKSCFGINLDERPVKTHAYMEKADGINKGKKEPATAD